VNKYINISGGKHVKLINKTSLKFKKNFFELSLVYYLYRLRYIHERQISQKKIREDFLRFWLYNEYAVEYNIIKRLLYTQLSVTIRQYHKLLLAYQ